MVFLPSCVNIWDSAVSVFCWEFEEGAGRSKQSQPLRCNALVNGSQTRMQSLRAPNRPVFSFDNLRDTNTVHIDRLSCGKKAAMDFNQALSRSHERGESLELLETFPWTYRVTQGLYTDDCYDHWTHGSPNSACQLSGTDLTARMMMKGCKWTFQVGYKMRIFIGIWLYCACYIIYLNATYRVTCFNMLRLDIYSLLDEWVI